MKNVFVIPDASRKKCIWKNIAVFLLCLIKSRSIAFNRVCVRNLALLFSIFVAMAALQGQSIPGKTLVADFQYLVKILKETHPDPYTGFGGKVFFHKSAFEIEQQLKNGGTLEEFYFIVSSFISRLEDGHTYIRKTQSNDNNTADLFLPVDFTVIQDGLIISQIADEYKELLGSKLHKINGASIAQLCGEARKLEPMENLYGQYDWLARNIKNYGQLKRIIPDLKESASIELESLKGAMNRIELTFIGVAALQNFSMASVTRGAMLHNSHLNYNYIDKDKQAMYFRVRTMMAREVYMHIKKQDGDNFQRQQLEDFYRNILRKEKPENIDEAIAGMPGYAETFRNMLEKMKADKAKYLIIDLRSNGGGWTPMVYPSLYMLYGNNYFDTDMGWQYYNLISPLLMKKWNTTLEIYNKSNNSSYQFGDYAFPVHSTNGDHDAAARRNNFWSHGLLGDAREYVKDLDGKPLYSPEKIFVATDESTFSAAFHYAYFLWKMGATIVGVPSRQAANSFMEITPFELPLTKLTGSISCAFQQLLPPTDNRVRVFYPDVMLSWKDYEKYDFHGDSVLFYLLDSLDLK